MFPSSLFSSQQIILNGFKSGLDVSKHNSLWTHDIYSIGSQCVQRGIEKSLCNQQPGSTAACIKYDGANNPGCVSNVRSKNLSADLFLISVTTEACGDETRLKRRADFSIWHLLSISLYVQHKGLWSLSQRATFPRAQSSVMSWASI